MVANKAFLEALLHEKKRLGEHTDITEVKKERAESYFTEASGENQESPLIPTNNAWKKLNKTTLSHLKHCFKIERHTLKTSNTLKPIYFFFGPLYEWRQPMPNPEQRELRPPWVTSEPEMTAPGPC